MSKINLEAPFQSFRGKICKHSKIIFAQRNANTALADATQKAAYETAFKAQTKYKSLRGYVIAKEYEKLA